MAVYLVQGEPIQWHITRTSRHDRCPKCGGAVDYFAARRRSCASHCSGKTDWEMPETPRAWLFACGFSRPEVLFLLHPPGQKPGRQREKWVSPGFLKDEVPA